MNLMMVGGIGRFSSFWLSLWMFTVSNALLRSSDTRIVRFGGCFWLKPSVIVFVKLCKAEVVECSGLKPC